MYLICYPSGYVVRQVKELRSDSQFYGWVQENDVGIYRCTDGRYERLAVVTEQRPGSKVLAFAAEWRPVAIGLTTEPVRCKVCGAETYPTPTGRQCAAYSNHKDGE